MSALNSVLSKLPHSRTLTLNISESTNSSAFGDALLIQNMQIALESAFSSPKTTYYSTSNPGISICNLELVAVCPDTIST